MNKTFNSVLKGVAVGTALGAATYMISNKDKRKKAKSLKKGTGKALKAVGTIVDSVSYMMK